MGDLKKLPNIAEKLEAQLIEVGVPTIEVDGRIFWGVDSIEMLVAYLHGDRWFDAAIWDAAGQMPPGVNRTHRA